MGKDKLTGRRCRKCVQGVDTARVFDVLLGKLEIATLGQHILGGDHELLVIL